METPILILEDALSQQKEQLSQLNKKTTYQNEKQLRIHSKAITNVYGFIAEIEEALNILKSNEPKIVRDNETKYGSCKGCKYYPRHLLRKVCAECDDWENYELIQ